jgi:antitoxin CcdA
MGKTELKIEIDSDLLARARDAGLSIAAFTEAQLRRALSELELERYRGLTDEQKARLWAEENAEAIKAQRKRIEQYGVFGEDLRTW